jgi:hypothetical protein
MLRALLALMLLVLGAVALARGLYLQTELTRQLETGTMGFIRSWVLWSTTDGRELVAWYRMVTPWLIWGGAGTLASGLVVALWPTAGAGKTREKPPGHRRKPH